MNEAVHLNPLISVVIPTYNHAHFLGCALQSVLNQTYTNWEAIVVDNYSSDNTDEVILKFLDSRIKFIKIHNNGIIAASRNMGISTAKGEWIAFLDSDDWWAVNKLQKCMEKINNNVDFIYHDLEIIREKSSVFQRKKIKSWQVNKPVVIDLMIRGNAIATSSVMVRKSLLNKTGGMSEDIDVVAAEDYNTWLCIARVTDHFIYLPNTLGYYLFNSQGVSRKDMSMPTRQAVAEFIPLLNTKQRNKLESALRYKNGRFIQAAGDVEIARNIFYYCFRNGDSLVRLKVMVLLIGIYIIGLKKLILR